MPGSFLPQQRFKSLAFLATQPLFLYRNLLRSHDRLRRSSADESESLILSNWLKRATSEGASERN